MAQVYHQVICYVKLRVDVVDTEAKQVASHQFMVLREKGVTNVHGPHDADSLNVYKVDLGSVWVDVEDVAAEHVAPLLDPKSGHHRFLDYIVILVIRRAHEGAARALGIVAPHRIVPDVELPAPKIFTILWVSSFRKLISNIHFHTAQNQENSMLEILLAEVVANHKVYPLPKHC